MQYPIIDLLEDVGGESVTGKNLAKLIEDGYVPSINDGQLVLYPGCRTDYIKVTQNTSYTINVSSTAYNVVYCFYYTGQKEYISYINTAQVPLVLTTPSNAEYVMLRTTEGLSSITEFQFESGSVATDYEPYFSITFPQLSADDIAHRLKLPMLKYFPSEVYHALKALDNGETLSYEQYQVLEHYLLPLNLVQV